jgi:hypothetical protein
MRIQFLAFLTSFLRYSFRSGSLKIRNLFVESVSGTFGLNPKIEIIDPGPKIFDTGKSDLDLKLFEMSDPDLYH